MSHCSDRFAQIPYIVAKWSRDFTDWLKQKKGNWNKAAYYTCIMLTKSYCSYKKTCSLFFSAGSCIGVYNLFHLSTYATWYPLLSKNIIAHVRCSSSYRFSLSLASSESITSPSYSTTTSPLSTSLAAKAQTPAFRGSVGTSWSCRKKDKNMDYGKNCIIDEYYLNFHHHRHHHHELST